MTSNLWHFTRGSELMRHRIALFGKSLSGLLLLFGLIVAAVVLVEINRTLTEHDLTLVLLRLKAEMWLWLELDPSKPVMLPDSKGSAVLRTMAQVPAHAAVVLAWGRLVAAVGTGLFLGSLLAAPLVVGLWGWFRHFGRETPAEHHDRGALLTSGRDLARLLDTANAVERAHAYRSTLGVLWWWKILFAQQKTLSHAGLYRPYTLAGYPYPWGLEVAHGIVCAAPRRFATRVMTPPRNLRRLRARWLPIE